MARGRPTFADAMKQRFERPWDGRTIVRAVDDHDSALVKIVWPRLNRQSSPLPPFPFHVYLIRGADSLVADEVLCDKLICYLDYWQQLSDPCWHLEVYASVQDNVFACIDHFEKEKVSREREGESPYMPDKKCFLVVDSVKWEDEGLLSVEYTTDNAHLPYNVKAERYKSWESLASRLRQQWSAQGMTTVEELLDERNAARGWPIDLDLYDENGPEQSVNATDLTSDETRQPQHQPAGEKLDLQSILKLDDVHVDGVVEEQCQDSKGTPYTALRHASRQAPLFTFCLFVLGRGTSSNDRLAVFASLNSGLLTDISWSLHLYSDATMASGFSTFAREMVFRRHLDTPTYMPSSYAGLPLQGYRDVYMCLDTSKPRSDGPSFVLSVPIPDHNFSQQPDDFKTSGESDGLDIVTFNLGSWDLAADMLHTYFTLCSQVQPIARSLSPPLPRVSLRISVKPEYSSDSAIPSPVELDLTSHAPDPITLNVQGTIFDTTDWQSCLRIVNVGSSVELSRDLSTERPSRSWSLGPRLLDYGFTKRVQETDEDRPPHLVTLHPGVPLRLPVQRPLLADLLADLRPDDDEGDRAFLKDHEAGGEAHFNPPNNSRQSLYNRYQGSWEVGRKYSVELRGGTMIPRWTWGTEKELKGPYGLPPLEIDMEERGNREFVLTD